MRQIKNYMRSKRTMWNCQEPVCATLNARKCMNEFCGCGEGKDFTAGNKVYIVKFDESTEEVEAKIFISGNSYILYKAEGDVSNIYLKGAFNSKGGNTLSEVISGDMGLFIIGKGGTLPSAGMTGDIDDDVMELINNLIKDPSDGNRQALSTALSRASSNSTTFITYN